MKRIGWMVLGLCLAASAEGATPGPTVNSGPGGNTWQLVITRSTTANFAAGVLDTALFDTQGAGWITAGTDSTAKTLLPVSISAVTMNATGVDSIGVLIDAGATAAGVFANDVGQFLVTSGTRTVKVCDLYARVWRIIVKNKEAAAAKYKIVITFPR